MTSPYGARGNLTVGSLFSGIGGLDLGLERAGMTVRWQAEIDPYCCRVLAKHWPDVPNLGDVTTIDWSTVEPVDLICGGYPCQPFSYAGARAGEHDDRHLWPHVLDAVRALRPRYVLMENVAGHLSLGLGRVLGDLAESGYDATWDCIPAASVGAPHRRDRVFIVAYPNGEGEHARPFDAEVASSPQPVADADGSGPPRGPGEAGRRPGSSRRLEPQRLGGVFAGGRPTARGDWSSEPDVGRVAHGVPSRVDRLRGLGNAVVPQVAEYVGRRLMEAAA